MSLTIIILVITCIVSFLAFNNRTMFDKLKHYPAVEHQRKEYYRWLTSGFLHGDYMHLIINMFVFHSFGTALEQYYTYHFGMIGGSILFGVTYLLTVILANIPTYYKHENNPYYTAIGASGGVSGILFIYILIYPWKNIYLYFSIGVPAIIFGVLYLWYESWAAKNQNDNIGHDAHFFGAIAGIMIAVVSRPAILPEFLRSLIENFPF
ncbi:MAG TPA: rhomboid family intramembrane serine protease [Saprospiraceae bacterium]|nr:rhomboid family intramembrane serine protease [Saprospiraceae bacterium]